MKGPKIKSSKIRVRVNSRSRLHQARTVPYPVANPRRTGPLTASRKKKKPKPKPMTATAAVARLRAILDKHNGEPNAVEAIRDHLNPSDQVKMSDAINTAAGLFKKGRRQSGVCVRVCYQNEFAHLVTCLKDMLIGATNQDAWKRRGYD